MEFSKNHMKNPETKNRVIRESFPDAVTTEITNALYNTEGGMFENTVKSIERHSGIGRKKFVAFKKSVE